MRQIKYRAFDSVTCHYWTNTEPNPSFWHIVKYRGLTADMFTGFKDMQGDDIYENDTLVYQSNLTTKRDLLQSFCVLYGGDYNAPSIEITGNVPNVIPIGSLLQSIPKQLNSFYIKVNLTKERILNAKNKSNEA